MDLTLGQFFVYQADFNELDASQTGSLEEPEIKTLLQRQLEREITETELRSFIDKCDLNQVSSLSCDDAQLCVYRMGVSVYTSTSVTW